MKSQNSITKSDTKKKSPALERKSAQKQSSDPLTYDYNPLENISCRIGDSVCAAKHVSVIQRTGLFHPMNENQKVQSLLRLQQQYGNRFVQRVIAQDAIQGKLKISQSGDIYEQEADRVAEQVMNMPEPQVQQQAEKEEELIQAQPIAGQITPLVQRQVEEKGKEEEELIQPKENSSSTAEVTSGIESGINSLRGGHPLPKSTCNYFELRLGSNFSKVRVHIDNQADQLAQILNARAFTVGRNIIFGSGQCSPRTRIGKRLLAHELTHVIQQGGAGKDREQHSALSTVGQPHIQRTLGDGHDLTSPRFSRILDLEAAYDDEKVIRYGSSGRGVQAIQQALYDLGFRLPGFGADGEFGKETKAAVKAYQRANPPLADDGEVGPLTMAALNARFGAPALPAPATRSAPWDADSPAYTCVRSILCPWSPHTIYVLRTRITLKSFDSISWADEEWNGTAWVPALFPGGGYNTGTEIGVLNDSCEGMSETLYHEVLHAEQPTTHRTTRERESYAYRIGEEFSIAMGLGGRPSLRSTDVQGRQYADPTKVGAFVATEYPSVPASGANEEIIGKAVTHGHVRVQRPNGTIYTRPAAVGEKVPGPMTAVKEVTHPTAGWTCP